jgi:hypothetical protein
MIFVGLFEKTANAGKAFSKTPLHALKNENIDLLYPNLAPTL